MKNKLLVLLLVLAGCSELPVTPTPIPEKTPKLMALDSFNNPNLDTTNWKSSITRTIFKNAVTGFVIKGELCLLAGKANLLLPYEVKNPSAKEYAPGVYYDAMVPLTTTNCLDAKYAWIDVESSQTWEDLSINIKKLEQDSPKPLIPLMVQLDPYNYAKGMHKGVVVDNTEPIAKFALQMLVDHRLQPIKSWAQPYKTYSDVYGFKEYVHTYSKELVSVPDFGNLSLLNTDVIKYKIDRPWFYAKDEPTDFVTLKKELDALKLKAPNVATMVTTTFKKDLKIDIYVPVAEHFGFDGHPGREAYPGRLWMYVSCMSNGCENNRDWDKGESKKSIITSRSGTPDLAIDAPLSDSFGFFQLAIKYKLEALLYYNSVEQWSLAKYGIDIFKDCYNFGSHGDGTLIYPDYANLKPLPSLRLKMLREASLYADAIIISNSQDYISEKVKDTKNWVFDYSDREYIYGKLR